MKKKTSRSGLFLIELVIVILFFSVSSAICMRIFASAYLSNRYSRAQNEASDAISSVSSIYKTAQGDISGTADMYGAEFEGGKLTKEIGGMVLTLTEKENEKYYKSASITVVEGEKIIGEATVIYAHEAKS